jgi:hypothetical protein
MLVPKRSAVVLCMAMNNGVANPEQLAMLTKALEDFASEAHVVPGTQAYEDAAYQIMFLYECGFSTAEDLVKAMRIGKRIAS